MRTIGFLDDFISLFAANSVYVKVAGKDALANNVMHQLAPEVKPTATITTWEPYEYTYLSSRCVGRMG